MDNNNKKETTVIRISRDLDEHIMKNGKYGESKSDVLERLLGIVPKEK